MGRIDTPRGGYKMQTTPPIRTGVIAPLDGQIVENLMDALKELLEERLRNYRLPVKRGEEPERSIKVHTAFMDDPDEDAERIPYICIQPLNGKDEYGHSGQVEGNVNLRLVITIFNRDKREGRLQLLRIIQIIRRELIRTGVVGKSFELKMPLEWLIYPDDTDSYHVGEMSTTWSIPPEERFVPELRDDSWEWLHGGKRN